MKSILIGFAALTLAAGTAVAAPGYGKGHGYGHGPGHGYVSRVTPYERVAIARSAAHVAQVKRHAMRDGRISFVERFQIRRAEQRHAMLVARARRS